MEPKDYLTLLARALTFELTANATIREFTNNPMLIGAFAEATVRKFVERAVAPLRVSRGAIVHQGNCGNRVKSQPPEVDTIIWTPGFLPAVFDVGDFALVPRGSAVASLEIKSTNYTDAADRIEHALTATEDLLYWTGEPGHLKGCKPRSLGVVCIRWSESDTRLDELLESKRAVQLLVRKSDETIDADPPGIYELLRFLVATRYRAKEIDGIMSVNHEAFYYDAAWLGTTK